MCLLYTVLSCYIQLYWGLVQYSKLQLNLPDSLFMCLLYTVLSCYIQLYWGLVQYSKLQLNLPDSLPCLCAFYTQYFPVTFSYIGG